MKSVTVEVQIDAPPEAVWAVVTDIEGAVDTISAIDEVEILERPEAGIRGLRWRERRTMFGKEATETMWITDAEEGSHYDTEARSHGSIYRTRVELAAVDGETRLSMHFSAEPTTLLARVMTLVLGPLMRRAVRDALAQDLQDIRTAAQARRGTAPPV